MDRFQHAVENGDTWRILWGDKLAKPRGELIVHAAAATMWTSLCALADVHMTRESDAGRGPVDFKFSAGWHRHALIEVKLLSSSKLFRGADAQLPQYLASEQVSCAYYVCPGFTDPRPSARAPHTRARYLRRLRGQIRERGHTTVNRCAPEVARFTPDHLRQPTRQSLIISVNPAHRGHGRDAYPPAKLAPCPMSSVHVAHRRQPEEWRASRSRSATSWPAYGSNSWLPRHKLASPLIVDP